MAKTEQKEVSPAPTREAFSDCGCHRGELVNGVITITQVNDKCAHGLGDTPVVVPKGAAQDIGSILTGLGA